LFGFIIIGLVKLRS